MIKSIRKRDGRLVDFEVDKIAGALYKAFSACFDKVELKKVYAIAHDVEKRLEEKELIARCPSSNDARYKCLHLTEKGREVICKSFQFGANHIEKQLVKGMTDDEVKMLKDLLYRSLENMEE